MTSRRRSSSRIMRRAFAPPGAVSSNTALSGQRWIFPQAAVAAAAAAVVATNKKVKQVNKRKRNTTQRGDRKTKKNSQGNKVSMDETDEEEDDEDDEEIEDEEEANRVTKKTKRLTNKSTTTEAAAASSTSSSTSSSFSSSSFSPATRCSSDSLSLIFSFLTTHEFIHSSSVVSKSWSHVSRMSTSWPRYSFVDSAVSGFRDHSRLQPDQSQHHRHITASHLLKAIESRDHTSGVVSTVCKNLSALNITTNDHEPSEHATLLLLKFPHLTSLRYETSKIRYRNPTRMKYGVDVGPLIEKLRVLVMTTTDISDRVPAPTIILFMQLRVLSLSNMFFEEEILLPLQQLEYFRYEASQPINSRLTRVLRYLSSKFALRSVILRRWLGTTSYVQDNGTKWLESHSIAVLCTEAKVAGDVDPLPHENGMPMILPMPILHEFELGVILSMKKFASVCTLPLQRLTFTFEPGLLTTNPFRVGSSDTNDVVASPPPAAAVSSLDTLIPLSSMHPALLGLQHLNLTLNLPDEYLHDLAACTQLVSLRLECQGERAYDINWLTSLSRLEDLTLEFTRTDNRITRLEPASYVWIRSLTCLKKLALHLKTGPQFPSHIIAQHLASLPGFACFSLNFHNGSYFALTPSFLTAAVVSAPHWMSFHIAVPWDDEKLWRSFESPIHRLPITTLLSSRLTQFRVFRHGDQHRSRNGQTMTQFRIEVGARDSSSINGKPPTATWRAC